MLIARPPRHYNPSPRFGLRASCPDCGGAMDAENAREFNCCASCRDEHFAAAMDDLDDIDDVGMCEYCGRSLLGSCTHVPSGAVACHQCAFEVWGPSWGYEDPNVYEDDE